jgi:uncharacterized membrane protein YccC
MAAPNPDPTARQSRLVRRLARLFRLERAGAFYRRSAETAWRLISRRGQLMAELTRLERHRREARVPPSPELDTAVRELAEEVALSRTYGETLAASVGAELRARRGAAMPSGLRDGGGGRLLGSG